MKHLMAIQAELKAPKGQYNSFGKYKYRSAEDILEAVKPLCHKHGCVLTLSDEIVNMGDRFYVKAYAELKTPEDHFVVTAYAREEETKKGMDLEISTTQESKQLEKLENKFSYFVKENVVKGVMYSDDLPRKEDE